MNLLLSFVLLASMSGPLGDTTVTTEWLAANLDNPDLVVVEVGAAQTPNQPHIPGALFVHIDAIVEHGWPPDELPDVDTLRHAFGNAGVGDEGRIVLYSRNPLHATRAWFTLDYLGQSHRAAILSGGFGKWQAERRPVTMARAPHLPKTLTARAHRSRVISHADMRFEDLTNFVLIDARPADEFYGLRRGHDVARRGHIPNAHCLPWQNNLEADGTFRPARELRRQYAELGATLDSRLVVYCRTGMEASMPYFVLRSLGYDVVLYDGSFTEWSRDPHAPVVKSVARR